MTCYRNGGCGPYEMRPCNECPASKPEYAKRYKTSYCPICDKILDFTTNDTIAHCPTCGHHLNLKEI